VDTAKEKAFLQAMKGTPAVRVGATIANPVLRFTGLDGRPLLEECLMALKHSWQKTLPEAFEGKAS
jgi:hypothetical protein